jgi:hypothetical protein
MSGRGFHGAIANEFNHRATCALGGLALRVLIALDYLKRRGEHAQARVQGRS